jgi:myosin I
MVDTEDMVYLSKVNEQTVLENLQNRFDSRQIYTFIGSDDIILINPFSPEFLPFDPLPCYNDTFPHEQPPHIFSVAESCLRDLKNDEKNQSIVIRGESGSGKTEATKGLVRYVMSRFESIPGVPSFHSHLVAVDPVLEAFGNAKTLRNHNSSRFVRTLYAYIYTINLPLSQSPFLNHSHFQST